MGRLDVRLLDHDYPLAAFTVLNTDTGVVSVRLPRGASELTIIHEAAHALCALRWPDLFVKASPARREAAALRAELHYGLLSDVKKKWDAPWRNQEASAWAVFMAVDAMRTGEAFDDAAVEQDMHRILRGDYDVNC